MSTEVRIKRGIVGRRFTETITLDDVEALPSTPGRVLFLLRRGDTLHELAAEVVSMAFDASHSTLTMVLEYVTAAGDLDLPDWSRWRQEWWWAWLNASDEVTADGRYPDPPDGADDDVWNYVLITPNLSDAA